MQKQKEAHSLLKDNKKLLMFSNIYHKQQHFNYMIIYRVMAQPENFLPDKNGCTCKKLIRAVTTITIIFWNQYIKITYSPFSCITCLANVYFRSNINRRPNTPCWLCSWILQDTSDQSSSSAIKMNALLMISSYRLYIK